MKALLRRFPNINRDRAGDMTCAGMMHWGGMFDCPAPAKVSPWAGGRWRAQSGPAPGEVLGAVFDPERLSRPLLEPSRSTLALRLRKVCLHFYFKLLFCLPSLGLLMPIIAPASDIY